MKAVWLALLVLAPALAGCADDDAPPQEEEAPLQRNGAVTGASTTAPTPAPVKPKGTSERWHFHDYWRGAPTIVLLETNVTLNATVGHDGLPALAALVELPTGTIVPAETGYLTVNVTWAPKTEGIVNFTYRPGDSNDFTPAADLASGEAFVIPTTESMCDVPHRQQSFWRFNFTAKAAGTPPQLPARELHVVITATIGRPLFIDPPHLDWWMDGDVVPLVQGAKGEVATASTRAGNLTLGAVPAPPAPQPIRVQMDEGRIVPEGAKSIVAFLNWTSDLPGDAKLVLSYKEGNYPSEGAMTLKTDGKNSRLFVLPIAQAQTDTTYSNRTTWEFHVTPEGSEGAFRGKFEVVAWVARLSPDAAAALVTA